MSTKINNIAVLTSGGDAPGMNAAIRAVTRTALYYGKKVFGVYRGYEGMIENDIVELSTTSVKHILALGGTFLKSARSQEFRTPEGRAKAAQNLRERNRKKTENTRQGRSRLAKHIKNFMCSV